MIFRLFAASVVVAASAGAAAFHSVGAQALEPYSVLVSGSAARVSFPLSTLGEWQWCRPETRDAGLEYSWTATVENAGQSYAFGLFLFKCHRPGATSGTFADLVHAGQMGV